MNARNSNRNYVDKYCDSYDAMAEDFSNNSSYNSSVKYRKSDGGGGGIKLYISNIPLDLSESGLQGIFSAARFDAYNPYIGEKKKNNPKAWGFIELRTPGEAQSAINVLHKTPPHNLYLTYAQKKQKNDDADQDQFDRASVMSRPIRLEDIPTCRRNYDGASELLDSNEDEPWISLEVVQGEKNTQETQMSSVLCS